MTFISTGFVFFVLLSAVIFYLFPAKKRWCVLLAASYIFYACASLKSCIYLVFSTLLSFFIALWIQKVKDRYADLISKAEDRTEKKVLKEKCRKNKKIVAGIGVCACFGILAVLKYSNFFLMNISSIIVLFKSDYVFKPIKFLIPMGISFYTFSIVSYIIDVYNSKYDAEKNIFRYALCVSYFPSIVQGPINRNNDLRHEFFEKEHNFNLKNTQFAVQRILWGLMKKLVIADRAGQVVSYIFEEYASLPNFIIMFGLVFYSIQLYADFAGGMDIALGVSELFGIKLKENFRQPYFSQSIAEFWRRWHITLGTWMKDYIFYPFALSKTMLEFGKKLSAKNKYLGRVVPMALANILVFLVVGIWHGAEWHFVFYGLFHGGIIAFSVMMEPLYKKGINAFHINEKSRAWQLFRILRTFYLVNIGALVDDVKDMGQAWGMTKQLFSFTNWNLISNFSFNSFGKLTILVVLVFCILWIAVSIMKEKNIDVREKIAASPIAVRWIIYLFLILGTPFFQSSNMAGFMYALF